jgi:sec-independent protein translocase protein TatA
MPNIGPLELIVVLVIVLLIFGPKRLPSLGRQLGSGMREFKESITGKDDARDSDRDATARPALNQAQADEPVATPPATAAERATSDAAPDQRA